MKEIVQEGKTREEALKNALESLGASEDDVEVEVIDGGGGGILGLIGSKPIKIKVTLKEKGAAGSVGDFFRKIFEYMGIDSEFNVEESEKEIRVDINGREAGILIGKFGQTLDSLQYLANVFVGRRSEGTEQKKVLVDVENYRQRREESLEQLAKSMASKVTKTKKSVALAPMPPHDRRIVHLALADHSRIKTHSEGTGVNRKVIISYREG